MGFSLLFRNTLDLWKEWEMRLLVLLSLFLQLTLATQVRRRRFLFRSWIHVIVWTSYLLADSVATLTLSILSSRLANIQETKGTTNPKSQITAFWAPFLLLHLGEPDTITAYVQKDNELWLRQLARLCIQVGLVCFIYFVALAGSTLSMLAMGMALVGFMKYAERILCLYLASEGRLRDSMLLLWNFSSTYRSIMDRYALKKEEGYPVEFDKVTEVLALDEASNEEDATIMAYELFKNFKPLFLGLISKFSYLEFTKRQFMNMDSCKAFRIVEIELGFMYDLLYTKAPLLNFAWGIIRWVISLSVPFAVLLFFTLEDKKDYAKFDISITFLLISVAILLEIYSLLLAISSDWVCHWWLLRLGRSVISRALAPIQFYLNHLTKEKENEGWSKSVAQFSLLGLSLRRINKIYLKCPWLAKLEEKLVIFDIGYRKFRYSMENHIFDLMRDTVKDLEWNNRLKNGVASLKLEASKLLKRSNCCCLTWSVEEMEFDKSILIWHIATELCYYKDRYDRPDSFKEDIIPFKMSRLVSRYMLYLILLHPSMLPTGIGVLRYNDTLVDVRKSFEGYLAVMSKNEDSISSVVINWVKKLFKKERYFHTGVRSCKKGHVSRESRDLCELCHLLLRYEGNMRRPESRSVLLDACHLASQLNNIDSKWSLIGKVWAKFLIYAACQCKGHEHCESLSRGGELLSLVWLLMAHLGIAEAEETSEPECAAN